MSYIHESQNWPQFTWDNEILLPKISSIRYKQGKLFGAINSLGFNLKAEASLITLTNDIVKSSAIEGEIFNPQEVRSSIAKKLGINVGGVIPSSRDLDGIVEIMIDCTRNYNKPLTKDRLFGWHSALFPSGRSSFYKITVGNWRTDEAGPMQVVSGQIGNEKVHFEGPAAKLLDHEMDTFIKWCNEFNLDFVLKSAIAHLWFVTLHPFDDGNGRIGRAISDLFLTRSDGSPERYYSLSAQLEHERRDYYQHLERAQKGSLDISEWLFWFLSCLEKSIKNAEKSLETTLYKNQILTKLKNSSPNQRQEKVVNDLLNDFQGPLTTTKYAKMTACSHDSALRDIRDLIQKGILTQSDEGGRSTKYGLIKKTELN